MIEKSISQFTKHEGCEDIFRFLLSQEKTQIPTIKILLVLVNKDRIHNQSYTHDRPI